jgi:hypothetical protein
MASVALAPVPAMAQQTPRESNREYRDEVRDAQRDYRRDLRRADTPAERRAAQREYQRELRDARRDRREDRRDWRQYRNYDWNRPARGQRAYYADDYYRDGRYYQERRLTRQDRIYRGRDGRWLPGQCVVERAVECARHAAWRGRRCGAGCVDRPR